MKAGNWQPDPATRALLEKVAAGDLPSFSTMTPAEARQSMLDAGKVSDMDPLPVARVWDRAIPGPGGNLAVRCYAPREAAGDGLPTLLYFHGGGFVIGDLDTHDSICRKLCLTGDVAVMSVDYRLAPEHPYPAAVEDALAAYSWLSDNAPEIGADPNRLAVGGDSAGGTLAAVVSHHARHIGAEALRAQLLFYPTVDMGGDYASRVENADRFPIPRDVLDWFWEHYFRGVGATEATRLEPWASPLRAARFDGLAPAFVLTAGLDPLRGEGTAYASRLAEAGVETVHQCVTGTVHGFLRMGKLIPTVHDVLTGAGTFLKARMTERPTTA